MDKLPQELVNPPRPLVFITGEVETQPNIHDEIISQLYLHAKHDPKHEVHMNYESIASTYSFKEKSPSKDHPNSDGILKLDWMKKHCSLLPSVAILTASFGTDWPAGEWIRRETSIIESITHLKHFMHQRDVKVILILMKLGHQTIDKDVIDERLNAIKRHCQLESKSFVILSSKDLAVGLKDSMKRLTKTVRDYSAGYYVSQGKRLRGMERLIRPSEYTLLTRMNFKVAFFYEFQLQMSRALRNYKQCYASLIDLHKLSLSKPEKITQIKAVAEIVNFKLCNIQLKNGAVKEASQQFRHHMTTFSTSVGHFPWLDHTWAANQFLIYVSLLTHYSINTNHTDADRSYYYHRAALCTQKRQEAFQTKQRSHNEGQEQGDLHTQYSNISTKEPKFFGAPTEYISNPKPVSKLTAAAATVVSVPSPTDLYHIAQHSQLLIEEQVNHIDEILALLQKSLKNMNPLHKRRKSHIRVLIAKQLMSIGDYDMASAHLSSLIDFLYREQWSFCAIPVLRKKILCAIYLGRPREYIPAALKLYKIAVLDDFLEIEDRMELHRDLMSVICNTEKPTQAYLQSIRQDHDGETSAVAVVNETSETKYVNLPLRPEYGAAAILSHPPEYFLPDSYTVELGDVSNGLFRIDISYDKKSIEVGHHVKTQIAVTSLFQDVIQFTEMVAYFTDDVITQKFIHSENVSDNGDDRGACEEQGIVRQQSSVVTTTGSASDDSLPSVSTSNTTYACLEFHPHVKKTFSFDLFISENSLYKNEMNHICLERLLLTMSVPLPTQTSGEAITTLEEGEDHTDGRLEDASLMIDSLQIEESLQVELQQESMDVAAAALLHPDNEQMDMDDKLPENSLPLRETVTLQLEESGLHPDEVNIDMQEESLDIHNTDQFVSHDMEDEVDERGEEESKGLDESESEDEANKEEEEKDEEEEERDFNHDTDEDDDDALDLNNDDDLTPSTTPAKTVTSIDERDLSSPNVIYALENTTHLDEKEDVEEEETFDDDDDIDPHRMSTSRLGVMVTDLNKLDPVMPVVVDKEMQKNRSRSSSLTPSYAAELLSSTSLPAGSTTSAETSAAVTTTSTTTTDSIPAGSFENSTHRHSVSEVSTRVKSSSILPSSTSSSEVESMHHPRTQSLPPFNQALSLSTKNQPNEIMLQRGYRAIFFNASALSKTFREARSSNFGTPARAKEIADFLDMSNAPKLLAVTPPISYLELLSPVPTVDDSPICILQGTIQRVNFVFTSGNHKMLQTKVYLKSDYHQLRNGSGSGSGKEVPEDSPFFWYPNISSLQPNGKDFSSQNSLDTIHFHPFTNSADQNQPIYPLTVNNQEVNSLFACPVFIKSDVQGDINLTLKVEYVPSIFLKNAIVKEFNVKIRVLKPFGMNFNISSLSDPHCGSEKKQGTSNVLRGDLINMAASLDCVNSLAFDVEVLVMTVTTKNATIFTDTQTDENIDVPVFKLANNNATVLGEEDTQDSVCDLLRYGVTHLPAASPVTDTDTSTKTQSNRLVKSYITQRIGEKQTVILQKGEAYVGSADLLCLPLESAETTLGMKYKNMFSEMNASISASMGDIIVNWRINDPFFFRAVDLSPFQINESQKEEERETPINNSKNSGASSASESALSWLLPLAEHLPVPSSPSDAPPVPSNPVSPLNTLITHTRVCNMLFSVPKVQVIDAPFAVTIDTPAVVNFGESFTIHLHVFNKLQTMERVVMVAELTSEFLMTGGSYQALEVAPHASLAIDLTLVPLIAGQVPLPHVCLTCERTKSTVLEFGTYTIPRHVFVKPVPVVL